MSMKSDQAEAAFHATAEGQRALNMDVTLLAELDRLAADYDITADMCLTQIMMLQTERGGSVAIAAMAAEINHAWSRFKMGSRDPAYSALKRTYTEASAAADGEL